MVVGHVSGKRVELDFVKTLKVYPEFTFGTYAKKQKDYMLFNFFFYFIKIKNKVSFLEN